MIVIKYLVLTKTTCIFKNSLKLIKIAKGLIP